MESYHKKKIGSIPKDSTGGSSIRKGMVVFNGGTSETGLVGDVTGNCVSVPVRMTAGRELVTDDAVMFLNDCREASAEQKIALQRLLNEGHLAWNKRRGVCSESLYAPKDGQLVKLSILDEHVILGAFKEIDAKGRVVLYCLLDEDGSLRYSLHETVGYAVNLQILPIGTSGRSRLSDALRQKGLAWNGRLKELERLATRVRRGDKYYYLNDILEIRECRDNNRPADRKRLECGNYFMERRDAELVRDCVRSVVRLNRDKDARR